ncbi:MAG: acetyl-CoA C-acetyltransferase, partial [Nevskiales bacterium]
MSQTVRPAAIVGGARIPFARSNTVYSHLSNKDMLTGTLKAVVDKYGLVGERLGEVVAGAVLKHSRDFNLTRESVLSSGLAPETAACDVQMACGTGLQAAINVANKIALGQIDCGIAGGVDTTSDAPIAVGDKLRTLLLDLNRAKSGGERARLLLRFRLSMLVPLTPSVQEPRTKLSMGDSCELMVKEWGITREAQDQLAYASHSNAAKGYDEGFFDDLVVP